jgi:hypothetical protein
VHCFVSQFRLHYTDIQGASDGFDIMCVESLPRKVQLLGFAVDIAESRLELACEDGLARA